MTTEGFPTFPTVFSEEEEVRITELRKLQEQQQSLYSAQFSPEKWRSKNIFERAWRNVAAEVYAPPKQIREWTPWTEMGFTPQQAESYIRETQLELFELERQKVVAALSVSAKDILTALALGGLLSGEEAELYELIPALDPNSPDKLDVTDAERDWFIKLNETLAKSSKEDIMKLYEGFPAPKTMEELVQEIGVVLKHITPEQILSSVAFSKDTEQIAEALRMAYPPEVSGELSLEELAEKAIRDKVDAGLKYVGITPTGDLEKDSQTLARVQTAMQRQAGAPYVHTLEDGTTVVITKRDDGFYYNGVKVANTLEGKPVPMTPEEEFIEDNAPKDRLDPRLHLPTEIAIMLDDSAVKKFWELPADEKGNVSESAMREWALESFGETREEAWDNLNAIYLKFSPQKDFQGKDFMEYLDDLWKGDITFKNPLEDTFNLFRTVGHSLLDPILREEDARIIDDLTVNFELGVADVISTLSGVAGWANLKSTADYLKQQAASIAPNPTDDLGAFQWVHLLNPRFYAIRLGRAMPFTLALLPTALIGWEAGFAVGGTMAAKLGLGMFGRTILSTITGGIGGAALSRPVESAMEAGNAWNQVMMNPDATEADGDRAAGGTFWDNMKFVGLDAVQIASAFAPTPFRSLANAFNQGLLKTAKIGGRLVIVGLSEGGEEVFQEAITRINTGDTDVWKFDEAMKQSLIVGAMMGIGQQAGGQLLSGIISRTEQSIPVKNKAAYDAKVKAEGQKAALDEYAATPEGKEVIRQAVEASNEEALNSLTKNPAKRVFTKEIAFINSQVEAVEAELTGFRKSFELQQARAVNESLSVWERKEAASSAQNIFSLISEALVKINSLNVERSRFERLQGQSDLMTVLALGGTVNQSTWNALNYEARTELAEKAGIARTAALLDWSKLSEVQQKKLVATKAAPTVTFNEGINVTQRGTIIALLNDINLDFMGMRDIEVSINEAKVQETENSQRTQELLAPEEHVSAIFDPMTGELVFRNAKAVRRDVTLHEIGHAIFSSKIGDPEFASSVADTYEIPSAKRLEGLWWFAPSPEIRAIREQFGDDFAAYADDPASLPSKTREFFEKYFPRVRTKAVKQDQFRKDWDTAFTEQQKLDKCNLAGIARTARLSKWDDLSNTQQDRLMGIFAPVSKAQEAVDPVAERVFTDAANMNLVLFGTEETRPAAAKGVHEQLLDDAAKILPKKFGGQFRGKGEVTVAPEMVAAAKKAKELGKELKELSTKYDSMVKAMTKNPVLKSRSYLAQLEALERAIHVVKTEKFSYEDFAAGNQMIDTHWDNEAVTKEAQAVTGHLALRKVSPDTHARGAKFDAIDGIIKSIDEEFYGTDTNIPLDVAATMGWKFDDLELFTRALPNKEDMKVSSAFKKSKFQNARETNLRRMDTYRAVSFIDYGKLCGSLWNAVFKTSDRLFMAQQHAYAVLESRYYELEKNTGFDKLRPNMVLRGKREDFNNNTYTLVQLIGHREQLMDNDVLRNQAKVKEIMAFYSLEEQDTLLNWAKGVRSLMDELVIHQNVVRAKMDKSLIPYRQNYIPHVFEANVWGRLQGFFYSQANKPNFVKDYAVTPDFIQPTHPFNARALARTGGLKNYEKITDVRRLVTDYFDVATRDMFFTPLVMNAKIHAAAMEEQAPVAAKWVVDWATEAFAGSLPTATRAVLKTPILAEAYRPLTWMRRRLIAAVFPLNWSWNIGVQQSSIGLTVLQQGMRNTARATIGYFTHKNVRDMIRNNCYSFIIKQQRFGSVIYQDLGASLTSAESARRSPLETAERATNLLTRLIEEYVTGISCYAGYLRGLEMGYEEGSRELIEFASQAGAKSQSMYNLQNVPAILRSPIVGVIAPFQTFMFEAMNAVGEMSSVKVLKAGAYETIAANSPEGKGLIQNRLKRFVEFMAAIWVLNIFGELFMDRKPWQPSSFVPFYSILSLGFDPFNKWNHPLPQRFAGELYTAMKQSIEYGDLEPVSRWLIRYFLVGGVQTERTLRGIIAVMDGGSVKDIEDEELYKLDPNEYWRAIIMGLNYTESAEQYRERMKGADANFDAVMDKIGENSSKLGTSQKGDYYTLRDYGRDFMAAIKEHEIPTWVVLDESLGFPELARFRAYCEYTLWTEYESLPADTRLDYRRANPEVDASLVFWEKTSTLRSLEAQAALLRLFNTFLEGNVRAHWKGLPQIPDWAKILPE